MKLYKHYRFSVTQTKNSLLSGVIIIIFTALFSSVVRIYDNDQSKLNCTVKYCLLFIETKECILFILTKDSPNV